jgi:hypothetical protein
MRSNRLAILCAALGLASFLTPNSHAAVYNDASNDLGNNGLANLDITSVEVTNDSVNLIISVTTRSSANWTKYLIWIDTPTKANAAANSNGWGRPASMAAGEGADFFVGSWVDATPGNAQLWEFASTWGQHSTSPLTNLISGNTVTFTIPLSTLGLSAGNVIKFDVATSSDGGSDPGIDHASKQTQSNSGTGDAVWANPSTGGPMLSYTIASLADSDSDGLTDTWENTYFSNLDQTGSGDPDSDNLNNAGELAAGTNPTVADTDSDGLNDGAEVTTHTTNPTVADTDGDGVNDGAEITAGTNPKKTNYPAIYLAGNFLASWGTPTAAAGQAMTGISGDEFGWQTSFQFPTVNSFIGKFTVGTWDTNWGPSGTAGTAQQGGNDIPFNVTSTGWWTFTFNTDTLSYGFARKAFSNYLEYAAAYNLPADGSGGGQTEDYESDGLTNAEEFAANSSPTSSDTDEDTVPDAYEVNTSTTSPILADTDADTLPDWWEITVGLDAKSGTGANGATGNPDGDLFTNRQEYDGQSDPKSAASVPANRSVTFSLNLNRQISSGAFFTNSHTVEVWGTFNDWGNITNKFGLTNNGNGIYTGTHAVAGAEGAINLYKFVTFPSSNNAVFESGNDRPLVMGADGVATNLPTAYLGEVRPVTFSVNMGVQIALGRFSHGTNNKVFVVGQDVDGGWDPGTELSRVGSTDVYAGDAFMSGPSGQGSSYKFRANNSLGYEIDLDAVVAGDQTRQLTLGARDAIQSVTEVYFNNVDVAPANRTVTFAVNMNVQTNKSLFNPASQGVEVRGSFNGWAGGTATLTDADNDGIYTGSFVVAGDLGATAEYKFYRTGATGAGYEVLANNRTVTLGADGVNATLSTSYFNNDDGVGPVITRNGSATVNLTMGDSYSDAGATATDAIDGSVTVTPSGSVNTAVAGSYTITYNASDAAGNAATPVTRSVVVAAALGSTFAGAYPGKSMTDVAPNGLTYLANYAFGGDSNTQPILPVQDMSDPDKLRLIVVYRTDDPTLPLSGLRGEATTSLSGAWDLPDVSVTDGDRTGLPDNLTRKVISVDRGSDLKKFLRATVTR